MESATVTTSNLSIDQLKGLALDPAKVADQLKPILLSLTSDDMELRACAADCLQLIESLSAAQASAIESYSEHDCEFVVNWTCKLLGQAANVDDYQARLSSVLTEHASIGVRQTAAAALKNVTSPTARTITALQTAAQNSDPRLQRLAKETLEHFSK